MTSIDELRRMLDERGVEWTEVDKHTVWWGESTHHQASAYSSILFGESERVHLSAMVTPAQAIAATIGDADATPTRQGDADLLAENTKLRELCADAWHLFTEHGAVHPCDLPVVDAVRERMRELGVEVPDGD